MGCQQSQASKKFDVLADSTLTEGTPDINLGNPQSGDEGCAIQSSSPATDPQKTSIGPTTNPQPIKEPPTKPAEPEKTVPLPKEIPFVPITSHLGEQKSTRSYYRPKWLPLLIEDTTDADNQIALAGFAKDVFHNLSDVTHPMGIFGVCPRHADLSIPLAFNKHIVKNRPDFRAFEAVKNAHEGTGLINQADLHSGRTSTEAVEEDTRLILISEIRRTYAAIMQACGFDPRKKSSWSFMQRAMPLWSLPVCQEHLLSHHFFAREFLFDRGDLDNHEMGDPLPPKAYTKIINEIDGEVAADATGAYDRDADVKRGLAEARRQRARKLVMDSLNDWDEVLGQDHQSWMDESERIAKNYVPQVTDIVIMAPCTLTLGQWAMMKAVKRVWGMFFALDNAAEYGHWVMEAAAKNIFRNNFNTALDEDGSVRMLQFIRQKEIRAYFHPTELFKGEIGKKSWEIAREVVKGVRDAIANGNVDVPPLLAVYNCYNAAKSPTCDPQQISDPMIVFEYLNFVNNLVKIESSSDQHHVEEAGCMMPVASYAPAVVCEDTHATEENYRCAVKAARAKGLSEDETTRLVRREKVFVVKPSFEPLNNGCYVGMNLVNRMVPEYSKWLHSLLVTKPALQSPEQISAVLPIMELTMQDLQSPPCCSRPSFFCAKA